MRTPLPSSPGPGAPCASRSSFASGSGKACSTPSACISFATWRRTVSQSPLRIFTVLRRSTVFRHAASCFSVTVSVLALLLSSVQSSSTSRPGGVSAEGSAPSGDRSYLRQKAAYAVM